MQKHEFTFKDLCSYILYWAKEDGKTANNGLFESNELDSADGKRLSLILKKIVQESSIVSSDNMRYVNINELISQTRDLSQKKYQI